MAQDKIDFLLNLDSKEFSSKIDGAIGSVQGLQGALGKILPVTALVGAAFLALKTSLDLSFQAEKIKSLEVQFKNLADQAGLSGQAILSGMEKASDGLLGSVENMELANRAIIKLGGSASRIPEIMELARKASIITGNTIEQDFERISSAIASGQTKAIKDLGVKVDAEKVYRNYAASIGVAANALSEEAKQYAIANAILPQLQNKLKNVDTSVKQTTDSYTRFKNAIGGVFDAISRTSLVDSFRSAWTGAFNEMTKSLKALENSIKATFGTGEVSAEGLRNRIKEISADIDAEYKKPKELFSQVSVDAQKKRIEELQLKLQELYTSGTPDLLAQNFGKSEQKPVDAAPENQTNKEAEIQNQNKFYADLLTLRQQDLQNRIALEQTYDQVKYNIDSQRVLLEQQTQQRINEIRNDPNLNPQQRADLELQLEQNKAAQLAAIEQSASDRKIAALQRYEDAALSTADGVARAFQSGAMRAQASQEQFGATGRRVFQSFSNNATAAFVAFGAGQKSASEAAKGFLFGMLADEAFARGQIMFLSSVWPPNPAGLAGGAALMAFSGWLRSQAGGTGGGTGGSTVVTDGGGITNSASQSIAPNPSEEQEKKMLNIVIQGNVFDSAETGMRIVEMVKEVSDATDVRIVRS